MCFINLKVCSTWSFDIPNTTMFSKLHHVVKRILLSKTCRYFMEKGFICWIQIYLSNHHLTMCITIVMIYPCNRKNLVILTTILRNHPCNSNFQKHYHIWHRFDKYTSFYTVVHNIQLGMATNNRCPSILKY